MSDRLSHDIEKLQDKNSELYELLRRAVPELQRLHSNSERTESELSDLLVDIDEVLND